MTCHVHVAISIQPANPLGIKSMMLFSLFSAATLEDLGHNQGGTGSTIWATRIQLASTQGHQEL